MLNKLKDVLTLQSARILAYLGLFQNCRTVNGDYEVPHAVDEVDDKILDQYHFYLVVVLLDDLDNAGHLHEFGDHLAG